MIAVDLSEVSDKLGRPASFSLVFSMLSRIELIIQMSAEASCPFEIPQLVGILAPSCFLMLLSVSISGLFLFHPLLLEHRTQLLL